MLQLSSVHETAYKVKEKLWDEYAGFGATCLGMLSFGVTLAAGVGLMPMTLISLGTMGASYAALKPIFNLLERSTVAVEKTTLAIEKGTQEIDNVSQIIKRLEKKINKIIRNEDFDEDREPDIQHLVAQINGLVERVNQETMPTLNRTMENAQRITRTANEELLRDAAAIVGRYKMLFGGGLAAAAPAPGVPRASGHDGPQDDQVIESPSSSKSSTRTKKRQ